MGKTLTWTILGVDKTSPEFRKIAKSADDASKQLDSFGKDGSKSIGGVADAAAKAKAAAEDMAVRMSSAVEKATERIAKARQSEEDQLGKLRVAEARLAEVKDNSKAKASQLATAEENVAAALRRVGAAQSSVVAAQEKLNSARDAAIAQARKESADSNVKAKLDIDIRGGLDRVKAFAISELKSAGIIAGAAMGGGIAAGLSTVGAAGLFIGIAAAAQSSNENVKAAYSGMWEEIKAGAFDASSVLADDFIAGAEKLGKTFNRLRPQMQEAFTAVQPAVNDLFDGVDRLATQAMPGLVTAAKASALVTDNLATAMESTGRAVTNFLTEASEGAEASGESIEAFGRIVERLGSFGGRILADLANSSTMVFPALEGAVDSAATAVENLAKTALPALAGGAALSLTGLSLLLNLANALIGVLGPLAPGIMTVVTALKLVNALSFGGVSKSWDTFKNSIGEAPGLAGKAKAGLTGFITSGLGPLGVLAGIGAIALDKLGESQQRTAQRQQALTAAFRESKGAIDENVRATVAKSLADEGLLRKADAIGVSSGVLTDAWLGNKSAMDEVRAAAARYTKELEGQGQVEGQVAQGADALSTKAHEVVSAMQDQSGESAEAAKQGKLYAEAMEKGAAGAEGLAKANQKAADAIKAVNDALLALVNKDIAYRGAVDATAEAQRKATDALKAHGIKSTEFADASKGVESALANQVQAAYDLALANSVATTSLGREQDATVAMHREILGLASATGGTLPRALGLAVSKLSDTDLAALGATRKINELGNEVIRLPNGKDIIVRAEDRATATIQHIAGRSYSAVIRLTGQWAGFYDLPNGVRLSGSSARGNAEGGWIHGPGTGTSDSIPRMLSDGEFVVNAKDAAKNAAALEAMNSGRSLAASFAAMNPAAGGVGSGSASTVNVVIRIDPSSSGLARELGNALRHEIQSTTGGDSVRYFGQRA
jgi:hypothetical protein